MSPKIKNFYSRFMDEDHIELKNDIAAEHGFVSQTISNISFVFSSVSSYQPSANDGGVCSEQVPPYYVNYCNYNGAAQMLKKVLGPIDDVVTQDEYNLR